MNPYDASTLSTVLTAVINAVLAAALVRSIVVHYSILPSANFIKRLAGGTMTLSVDSHNVDPATPRKDGSRVVVSGAVKHIAVQEKERKSEKAFNIHMHHFMGVVTLICSSVMAIDPSAVRGIISFGLWYFMFVIVQTLAFGFIIYWTMCWVQFLAEYMQFDSKCVRIFCRVMLHSQVSFLLVYGLVLDSTLFKHDREECRVLMDGFKVIIGLAAVIQMFLICIFTYGTVRYLKKSPASKKQKEEDIRKILKRSAAINSLCFMFIFLTIVTIVTDFKRIFCAEKPFHWLTIFASTISGTPAAIYIVIVHFLGKEFRDAQDGAFKLGPTPTSAASSGPGGLSGSTGTGPVAVAMGGLEEFGASSQGSV